MNEVPITYTVIQGRGNASPWMPWEILLTDEEMTFYKSALESDTPLEDVAELEDALDRAYDAILAYEEECAKDWGEEFDDNWELRVRFVNPN